MADQQRAMAEAEEMARQMAEAEEMARAMSNEAESRAMRPLPPEELVIKLLAAVEVMTTPPSA